MTQGGHGQGKHFVIAVPLKGNDMKVKTAVGQTPMHTHSIEDFRHAHVFLGQAHERNEHKTWTVIAICAAMMVAEIVGGLWYGSVALVADGLHMSCRRAPYRCPGLYLLASICA